MRFEIEADAPLGLAIRIYFQERLRHRLYDLVLREFERYLSAGHTRRQLAKRLGKRPEQISRWLAGPGNLTLDTLSDLLLGLSGGELAMFVEHPAEKPRQSPRLPAPLVHLKRKAGAASNSNVTILAGATKTVVPISTIVIPIGALRSIQPVYAGVA